MTSVDNDPEVLDVTLPDDNGNKLVAAIEGVLAAQHAKPYETSLRNQNDAGRSSKGRFVMTTEARPDEVERRAHELYELHGREDGHDWDDWLQAEREIRGREPAVDSDDTPPATARRRRADWEFGLLHDETCRREPIDNPFGPKVFLSARNKLPPLRSE